MSFRPKIKHRIAAILFAIIPAFVVGSLVFGANVYYDLDDNTVKTLEHSEFISSSSTVADNKVFSVSQTGATTGTDYGIYATNTGNGTTNVGGYFSASGATNNYAAIFDSGNVGIGTTTPGSKLDVLQNSVSTALTVTQSGTGNIASFVGDSIASGTGLAISVDGLVNGKGIDLTSTSSVLTTGKLFNVDWSPGSATTATNDLVNINIGPNGTAGNLFNITDNGSSLFSVSETGIVSALPHSFTAAGDVSMAYDLLFTNQTSSYIKSNASLYLEAGESFESNDLVLKTYNQGNVVLDGNTTIAAEKSLTITGGTAFPLSPSEGQMFFRTDTKQLYIYANAKWQADRTTATKIVGTSWATNPSQNYEKADYVADGTGDQTEIEAAVAALPTGGGLVYLLDGTYNISASIDIVKSNVTLTGSGESTKIFLANAANTDVIIVGDASSPYSNIKISNLQIDGNDIGQTLTSRGIFFNGGATSKITYSLIDNVFLHDARHSGIRFNYADYNKIINSIIRDNNVENGSYSGGIRFGYADYNTVSGNKIINNSLAGITIGLSDNNVISDNIFQSNYRGVSTEGSIGSNNVVSNNTFQGGSGTAVTDLGSSTVIIGNIIRATGSHGISLENPNNTVTGNLIYEVGSGTYDGINISSDNNIISSNRIYDSAGSQNGINLISGGDNNQVLGNEITGTGFTTEVNDAGTGNTIQQRDQFEVEASSATTALTVTQSSTGNIVDLTGNSITTGTGVNLSLNGLTSGTGLNISSTSTGINSGKFLKITADGELLSAGSVYGIYSSLSGASVNNTNIAGYFSATGTGSTNYGLIVENGYVGIGTATPGAALDVNGRAKMTEFQLGTSAVAGQVLTTDVNGVGTWGDVPSSMPSGTTGQTLRYDGADWAANSLLFNDGTNIGIGTSIPSSKLTLSSSGDFALGDYNAVLIDDMEVVTDWPLTEVAGSGQSTVSLESAVVRKGSGVMKITTTVDVADGDYARKTFGVLQDYSSYERIGFWIRGTQTGQIISIQFNDDDANDDDIHTDDVVSDYNITISEANQWQYEEWNISGIAAASRNDVEWAQFIIDNDSLAPTFYIDQVRVYDYDERTSEMFVDNDGNLVVWGRGGIELGRGVPGSSLSSMKIGSANIEINQPLNVNVAGDTGMAYDLQFLNTGGANIISQGALTISAGDPNKTQNLTLTTQANLMSGDSGVVTSSTSKILTDTSKSWTVSEWVGGTIYIISGTGYSQERTILANDGTTITVDDAGTSTDWSPTPDTTSSYRLTYQQGGDVIVDVANSSNNIGGFKVAGMDNGSYVFRVGPDGNVEIGGNGTAGSNLTIKQNLSLTGGNITINKLNISQASTPTGTAAITGGSMSAATYYYVVTALNNNGETTKSTESSGLTVASGTTGSVVLSWASVNGASGYKIYRTTSSGTYSTPALITYVAAPITTYTDIAASASPGIPSAVNTTGGDIIGILSFSDASELTLSANTSGIITISQTYHRIDTNADAVTGDLATINGGTAGDILVLRAENGARDIVVKDGTGNIQLSADMTLDNVQDTIALVYDGTNWLEISRSGSGADVAESYYTDDLSIEAGDMVKISQLDEDLLRGEEKLKEHKYPAVSKTDKSYDSKLIGVISTSPAIGLGGGYDKLSSGAETRPLALTGRVPVKISLEGGKIETGDYLTTSSKPGIAMKAIKPGKVIGQALEPFDGNITECNTNFVKKSLFEENKGETKNNNDEAVSSNEIDKDEVKKDKDETITLVDCKKVESEIGKVMTFVQPGWYEGVSLILEDNKENIETSDGMLSSLALAVKSGMKELGVFIESGMIKIKALFVEDIVTSKLCMKGEDGEMVCIEKDQLEELLNKNQILPASTPSSVLDFSSLPLSDDILSPTSEATTTPTPTSTVMSEIISIPTPTPAPVLTATPEVTPIPIPIPTPLVTSTPALTPTPIPTIVPTSTPAPELTFYPISTPESVVDPMPTPSVSPTPSSTIEP